MLGQPPAVVERLVLAHPVQLLAVGDVGNLQGHRGGQSSVRMPQNARKQASPEACSGALLSFQQRPIVNPKELEPPPKEALFQAHQSPSEPLKTLQPANLTLTVLIGYNQLNRTSPNMT